MQDANLSYSLFCVLLCRLQFYPASLIMIADIQKAMGLFRISIPDFEQRAFREALVNAFSHRDYATLGRVRVQINDDGTVIANPGGFIEGIRADNLIDAEPHGRNPALADARKRIGLAERTGRGFDRIYEGSLLYGRLLPDYSQSTSNNVKLWLSGLISTVSFFIPK